MGNQLAQAVDRSFGAIASQLGRAQSAYQGAAPERRGRAAFVYLGAFCQSIVEAATLFGDRDSAALARELRDSYTREQIRSLIDRFRPPATAMARRLKAAPYAGGAGAAALATALVAFCRDSFALGKVLTDEMAAALHQLDRRTDARKSTRPTIGADALLEEHVKAVKDVVEGVIKNQLANIRREVDEFTPLGPTAGTKKNSVLHSIRNMAQLGRFLYLREHPALRPSFEKLKAELAEVFKLLDARVAVMPGLWHDVSEVRALFQRAGLV